MEHEQVAIARDEACWVRRQQALKELVILWVSAVSEIGDSH